MDPILPTAQLTQDPVSVLTIAYLVAFLAAFAVTVLLALFSAKHRRVPLVNVPLSLRRVLLGTAISSLGLLFGAERVLGIDAFGFSARTGMRIVAYAAVVFVACLAALLAGPGIASLIPNRRTDSAAAVLVFAVILSACALTASGSLNTSDFLSNYRLTKALVDNQTIYLSLPQDDPYQGPPVSKYGLGLPILSAPLYWAGEWLSPILYPPGRPGDLPRFLVMLTNDFVTAATGALLYLLSRRLGFRRTISCALTIGWALTTPAWVYADTLFGEPVVALCLLAAVLLLLEYERTPGPTRFVALALSSLALGYAPVTRASSVVVVPFCVAYAARAALRHSEGSALRLLLARLYPRVGRHAANQEGIDPLSLVQALAALTIPLGILGASVLWYNFARYGSTFDFGYAGESFSSSLLDGVYGLLASPGKGVLEYAPLVALGVLGWPAFLRERPATALLFIGLVGATLIEGAEWWAWWGGWCWGPRFLVPILPFLILPAGSLLSASTAARRAAWILGGLGVAVTLAGALVDVNAYLNSVSSAGIGEPSVYLRPDRSPIVGHMRHLLSGQSIDAQSFRLGSSGSLLLRFALIAAMVAGVVSAVLLVGPRGLARRDEEGTGDPESR